MLLGGRAAEQVCLGDISTGAANDLEKANRLLRQIITVYGMSDALKNLSLVAQQGPNFLGQSSPLAPHSPRLAEAVEAEHRRMLDEAYAYSTELLVKNRPQTGA